LFGLPAYKTTEGREEGYTTLASIGRELELVDEAQSSFARA
jgi:hypothetical protein